MNYELTIVRLDGEGSIGTLGTSPFSSTLSSIHQI